MSFIVTLWYALCVRFSQALTLSLSLPKLSTALSLQNDTSTVVL